MREVDFRRGLEHTVEVLQKQGLFLSSVGPEGEPNVMAIGWGTPGIMWGRQLFTVLVRPSRYTYGNIESSGEFVVSVPAAGMQEQITHCGTVSGRSHDKFEECDFKAVPAEHLEVSLIGGCARHYECRVLHRNDVIESQLDPEVRADCYGSGDFHRIYYGQVLRVAEPD